MKIFLSWSGDLSQRVACVLRDWIPAVIQLVRPYVSSEDIDKGARWSVDIASELESSRFGIICLTPDNLSAPWINFEAGALSKSLERSRVSPFLYGVKRSEVNGPLLQFQSTIFDKQDVERLLMSINACLDQQDQLSEPQLKRALKIWWPELVEMLKLPIDDHAEGDRVGGGDSRVEAMLEEVLELARGQELLLRSPAEFLPAAYLRFAMRGVGFSLTARGRWASLRDEVAEILKNLESIPELVASSSALFDVRARCLSLMEELELANRPYSRSSFATRLPGTPLRSGEQLRMGDPIRVVGNPVGHRNPFDDHSG